MSWIARATSLYRRLLHRQQVEEELNSEVESYFEILIERYMARGLSREEARRAARLEFDSPEQVKEKVRDTRMGSGMETTAQDIRYACRVLRKSPGFAIVAVLTLALGIGATTAIFSVVNTVLLKPLPVPDPDRFVVLVTTSVTDAGANDAGVSASPARFVHWRAQSDVLQDVSAFLRIGGLNYTGGDVVEQWESMQVSADTFRCWGLRILHGRGFTHEEDLPNGPRVVVISEGVWKRRFASDPQILGKKVSLSGEPYTVIGIVAEGPPLLEFGDRASEVYVPFQIDPNTSDQGQTFVVVARLKPGITLAQAKERLHASTAAYRAKFPNALGPKDDFTVEPLQEAMVSDVRLLLLVLAGAVSLVLLIACANVANLLLARAAGRRREIGIRLAIGAARGRVIRQLLTESTILSVAGGALGLLVGHAGIRSLLASATELPMVAPVELDWRVMGFALAVSLGTGIVFGLLPALQASRVDLNAALKDAGRSGTRWRQNKARAVLVVSEVSLAVILLVGSALLIRTFVALYQVDRGFETKNVISMRTSLSGPKYRKAAGIADTVRDGLARLRSLPGVVAATATCCLPMTGLWLSFDVVGRPQSSEPHTGEAGWSPVSPGYFEVFRIPVKRGRVFTDRDDGRSVPVAVINEAMAKRYWKDGDPLKDRMVIGKGIGKDFDGEPVRQIIGIVGDTREGLLETAPQPRMYVLQTQFPDAESAWLARLAPIAWVVRTNAEPHALVPAIREQLRQATALPVSDVKSMDEVMSMSTGQQRFNMLLMTIFGCSALVLAAIGIYGLIAYTVEQRTQEIGIRLALGANATQVRNMVVRQGMSLALAGVAVGLGAAWGLSRLLQDLLFGVTPRDPMVFIAVPLSLSAVALLAVWIPAQRALRVDPMVALRYE